MPKRVKYYSANRRKVYANGDAIDALTLFMLHGWTCHLCNKQINPHKRVPDWQAATIDHIKPLAQGGKHTWDNVAPAHLICNLQKGAGDFAPCQSMVYS